MILDSLKKNVEFWYFGTEEVQYRNLIQNAMIKFLYIQEQVSNRDVRIAIWKISEIGSIKDLGFTEEKR